jgi:hypothetical protein
MKQVMLLDNDLIFEKCVIQPTTNIKLKKEVQMTKEEELIINSDEEDEKYEETVKIVDDPKKDEECLDKRSLEENIESDMIELTDLHLENDDSIVLKKPEEVYYNIYRQARKKARMLKHQALLAFLEAKNIKKTYKLEDLEDEDSVISDLDFKSIEETLNYNMDI